MNKAKRVKLGVVAVDSGSLIICDPGYLGDWKDNDFDISASKLIDLKTGKEFVRPGNWEAIYRNGMTHNQAAEQGIIQEIPIKPDLTDFSYNGVAKRTLSADYTKPDQGQMNFKLGHAGRAVAFRSGLGDGLYEVIGHVKDLPDWGRRITKVEIILIEDECDNYKNISKHFFGKVK